MDHIQASRTGIKIMIEPKTMAGPVGEDSYTRHNDITLEERDPWATEKTCF